jgi:hypothetical protein
MTTTERLPTMIGATPGIRATPSRWFAVGFVTVVVAAVMWFGVSSPASAAHMNHSLHSYHTHLHGDHYDSYHYQAHGNICPQGYHRMQWNLVTHATMVEVNFSILCPNSSES